MRAQQALWTAQQGWTGHMGGPADLLLAFGGARTITDNGLWQELSARHPGAIVLGCSTGGEIHGSDVLDESLSVTALSFARTALRAAEAMVDAAAASFEAGQQIGKNLSAPDLKMIFVLSDGTRVNGSELVRGIRACVGAKVVITGGLAGDGPRFGTTYVGLNGTPTPGRVAAIGFYGNAIAVGHGSAGGWDEFGPERRITRSKGNVLYELDGKPALDLYKHYLGDDAQKLPGSALLFPLKVYPPDCADEALTRTIVAVSEEDHTMTFAGDMPEGFSAQLMRGNFDRLVEGAADAAYQATLPRSGDHVAVLVSCIGRKLLLGQRICEEVEAVRDVFGEGTVLTGFYSYGEVSPHAATNCAELHNQTMTITVFCESTGA
ncbi:MAG TPA: FIST N-terminal domain-containing protein [Micropepsaceae bacterium]|nr:FIST N-terminal domain-containing protein [Micropepsaceae bacterium]